MRRAPLIPEDLIQQEYCDHAADHDRQGAEHDARNRGAATGGLSPLYPSPCSNSGRDGAYAEDETAEGYPGKRQRDEPEYQRPDAQTVTRRRRRRRVASGPALHWPLHARLTADTTARSDAVVIDGAMPTPHTVRPVTGPDG